MTFWSIFRPTSSLEKGHKGREGKAEARKEGVEEGEEIVITIRYFNRSNLCNALTVE